VTDSRTHVRPARTFRSVRLARMAAAVSVVAIAVPASVVPVDAEGVAIAPGVVVDRERNEVRVAARVACNVGFLEQLVCLQGTREHESLLSIAVPPSSVHAGLLALGLEPGHPGRWRSDTDGSLVTQPPAGPEVEAFVRQIRGNLIREAALRSWTEADDGSSLASPLVFAGSEIRPNPPSLARIRGPGEHYVADFSGSVIGLATFGDEMIAVGTVHPHRDDVAAPVYRCRTGAMPAPGTAVTLIIRPTPRPSDSVP
jgi:hypothetical protein